jgi:hypothetical protein
MKDRFMGENTCLLYDLMHYLEENNKTGLLLLVDFEKAFDSIELKTGIMFDRSRETLRSH